MQWLNNLVESIVSKYPKGEIIVESGVSPSGTYHVGTLREVLLADAIMLELKFRGRVARHIHYVDDLDPLRKIPAGIAEEYSRYLGKPYQDIPAPDGSVGSYADYYLNDFLSAAKKLKMDMDVLRSSQKYRDGSMQAAIEKALTNVDSIRRAIETVSGRKLDEGWAPIQVMEDGYLKNRTFVEIDTKNKTITYLDHNENRQTISYQSGEVKLNWRVDWPARWWMVGVNVEPFGRDHATKGGSYDTGEAIVKDVFGGEAPIPLPYNFINRTGQTKKMSKSSGDTIAISDMLQVLPPEVVRYFTLRYSPQKQLFYDEVEGTAKLIDDYAELLAKKDKTPDEQQLIRLCSSGIAPIISRVPFTHLVASYQAALKDVDLTIETISRTEYAEVAKSDRITIEAELKYIDEWLRLWAPEDVKFELMLDVKADKFNSIQQKFMNLLAEKIEQAPAEADGEWFHKAIYELKDDVDLNPKQMFETLYQSLIGKSSGPRAGWFLSILPKKWLVKRLRLEG